MKKLSVKDIIEFRNKSERAKKSFVRNLKLEGDDRKPEGGGNYWIISISAIRNSFKNNDSRFISQKIYELQEKLEATEYERTKVMYKRNLDILYNYEVFDFSIWKPNETLYYLKKHFSDFIVTIKDLQIKAAPNDVFSFQVNDKTEIGAVWFIAKLGGYRRIELGMFTEMLFRYLENNYSKDYNINPRYCTAVDVVNKNYLNYSQLIEGEVSPLLDKTLDEINEITI